MRFRRFCGQGECFIGGRRGCLLWLAVRLCESVAGVAYVPRLPVYVG